MMVRLILCVIIVVSVSLLIVADDPCRFESSEKGVIDLSFIGKTDGTAAFSGITPSGSSNYQYSYNPCKSFNEGSACKNVSACQVSWDGKFQFALGTQDSAKWDAGDAGSNPTLSYRVGSKLTQVELICSENARGDVVVLGEGPPEVYRFRLTSKCACWNGCRARIPASGSDFLAPKTIFLAFIVALASLCMIVQHQ